MEGEKRMSNYKNVLVAYDGSEMSKKAMQTAADLLKGKEGGQLTVVNVWQMPVIGGEGIAIDLRRYQEESEKYAQKLVDEAESLVSEANIPVKKVVLNGHPSTRILEYAEENGIDLIVMGNRGLNALKRMFLGSVSLRVVQEAPCDVLIIK